MIIRSKKRRWAGFVARGEMKNAYKILAGNLKGKGYLNNL
jgi:hypothetical protein